MKGFTLVRSAGFTLVEVLIVTAITAVIAVLLVVIIINSTGLFYDQSSKVGQGLGSNDALAEVRKTIKESNGISVTYPSISPIYTTGATQLILKLSSIDSSSNIIPETYDYFVFAFADGRLRLKSFPNNLSNRENVDKILSSNVEKVHFQYLNSQNPPQEVAPATASKVRITLTLKQRSSGQDYEVSVATSEASLRND